MEGRDPAEGLVDQDTQHRPDHPGQGRKGREPGSRGNYLMPSWPPPLTQLQETASLSEEMGLRHTLRSSQLESSVM